MSSEEYKYWVAFSQMKKIGPAKFGRINRYFHSLKEAWSAPVVDFIQAGIEENLAQEITILKSQISPEEEWEKLAKEGIKIVTVADSQYPRLLKEIYNPPPLLYYRGAIEILNQFCLAVVGTRKFSAYGKQAAVEIVSRLATKGIVIVSGLALGIDAISHDACLKANGLTAAILGSGLDRQNIFPSANRYLASQIIEKGGAVISEFPLGTTPTTFTFPLRNRIIAGLSSGVLIIEAPENSGALITARHALEQNREVFAVPGSIFSANCRGTNKLLKDGAILVQNADDILETLNLKELDDFIAAREVIAGSPEEEIIMAVLSREPLHIDKIAKESKLKINALSSVITMMEMKGLVRDLGGKNYVLVK